MFCITYFSEKESKEVQVDASSTRFEQLVLLNPLSSSCVIVVRLKGLALEKF